MSGQAEIIDKVLKDFEDCGGLAPGGSTNIEDLAVSSLSLLPSNADETSNSQQSTEKQPGVLHDKGSRTSDRDQAAAGT
jgi:hypothetical protein